MWVILLLKYILLSDIFRILTCYHSKMRNDFKLTAKLYLMLTFAFLSECALLICKKY